MKIAILSRYQNTAKRGVESFAYELSQRLAKVHQVDLLTGSDSDSLKKVLAGHYDIVMPLNGRGQSLKVSLGRLFQPYKLVIGGHSGIGRDDIFNIAVAKPDVFIALTDYMKQWAQKWAWGSKVVKIPNGVDLDKFSAKGEKMKLGLESPIILSVGALVWYKHHERSIEAASRLKQGSLLLIGSGEEQEKLEKLGRQKLGDRFKIMQVDYQEMPKIYRSAEVFILPSWDREAFGIVYLEAMASGLPVVAPNDPPRREIVGEAGELTQTENPGEFAKAISKALSKNWGDIPRKQAEKFSWDMIAQRYQQCLENI
jgi:glycosyltransferase involved in cell wall biosynthesis